MKGLRLGLSLSGHPTPPPPIAVSDFKNGIYSINGVSKTFSEMWTPIESFWVDGVVMAIVPGTGLTLTGDPDSFTHGQAATWTKMQPALWSAVNPPAGCTVVFDSLVNSSAGKHGVSVTLYADDDNNFVQVWGVQNIFDHTYFASAFNSALDTTGPLIGSLSGNVMRRMAATLGPTQLKIATDGQLGVTEAMAAPDLSIFWVLFNLVPGVAGASVMTATLEKITFYPPIANEATLRALSA